MQGRRSRQVCARSGHTWETRRTPHGRKKKSARCQPQPGALKLWSQDLTGNYASAQATVYERAKANGLAALGQWTRG